MSFSCERKSEINERFFFLHKIPTSGLSPQPLQTVYAATKAYMDFFSRGLQIEYESSGITVQTICPSYICTSMTAFSDSLSQPSFFVPSPDSFAASAIRTLGTVYILGQ